MKYPVSDHFDGKRFFNRNRQGVPGPWKTIKMLATLRYKKWPDSVENRPVHNFNGATGSDQIAITFVNHATILIQLPGLSILTDPIWSERASPLSWAGPKRVRRPGIEFDSLPKIDLVIISHNHYDHMDLNTLKKLNESFSPRMLVPLGEKIRLKSLGAERVEEMDWWDKISLDPETAITFTPTQHFSSRGPFDRNKTLWGSYMIQSCGHSVYFAGDCGYSDYFKEIRARFNVIDIALLPIGAYEPRWFMKAIHMNPAEAVQAHLDLQSRQSIGIHFGTFQLTEEGIDDPVRHLHAALNQENLDPESFVTLGEGVTKIYSFVQTG